MPFNELKKWWTMISLLTKITQRGGLLKKRPGLEIHKSERRKPSKNLTDNGS